MHPILRNILAVIAGLVAGSAVNMALVMASGALIPPPVGADVTTLDGLRDSIHLFEPKHFLMPFLAHALGTLVGAYVAAKLASTHKLAMAMVVGAAFLCGGIFNALALPTPVWFEFADVVFAYLPMAWLGWRFGRPQRAP